MEALVGFDIDAIQELVFAPLRPVDIAGGSWLVEDFAERAERAAHEVGGRTVYVGGGNGLFLCPEATAEALADRLEQSFTDLTRGAGSCTATWVTAKDPFAEARQRLFDRLVDRKSVRWLLQPTQQLVARGTPPERWCRGCGQEPATTERQSGADDAEPLGAQCAARRDRGRRGPAGPREERVANTLDLDDLWETGEPNRDMVAVYLDADRAGEILGACTTPAELAELADGLRRASRRGLATAVRSLGLERRVLTPVIGGDDAVVICAARHGTSLVPALWDAIDDELGSLRRSVRFSAGVCLAPRFTPIRLVVERASTALREAKLRSYQSNEAHAAIASLTSRRLDSSAALVTGAPLPRSRWSALGALIDAAQAIGPSQRAGIATDLQAGSPAYVELALQYRASRARGDQAPALARLLDGTVALGQATGADRWAALAGVLALAEVR